MENFKGTLLLLAYFATYILGIIGGYQHSVKMLVTVILVPFWGNIYGVLTLLHWM